jgi:4-hydroxy-tetrahydrodipicolinate reductase
MAHKAIPELVVQKLGLTVTASRATAEPIVYDEPVSTRLIPEGRFEAGVCVGVRTRLEVTTEEGVVATGQIEQRMFLPGDVEHMTWEVEGTPRNRVRVERLDSAQATAGNLFNRIPDIIAAPPGIVPVTELGPLRSSAGRWPGGGM